MAAATSSAALSPRAWSLHAITTLYEGSRAISVADIFPKPVLAPVMTTTLRSASAAAFAEAARATPGPALTRPRRAPRPRASEGATA